MRRWLLDYLTCPTCPGDHDLELHAGESEGEDILGGHLACPCCARRFPIVRGIPRFVAADQDYCGNFGFQWQRWKAIQIDRLSGHRLSETRFFADSGWEPQWLAGKVIVDGGCGAGRFSDVAAGHGARVIACDISQAVEACRDNTAVHDGNVAPIQASLLELPLKKGRVDGVFCMGVIQHTPDPRRVMSALPGTLKPGGLLAYNFYENDLWWRLQWVKYLLRTFTPHLPLSWTLTLSKALVAMLFPLTRALSGIRKIRIVNHFVPIASVHAPELTREQQYAWTLLDTFDWYAPRYEKRQKHDEVAALLREAGLTEVRSRPGIACARAAGPGPQS